MEPEYGNSPSKVRRSVDFPDPFRPTSAVISPRCNSAVKLCKMGRPPRLTRSFSRVRSGGVVHCVGRGIVPGMFKSFTTEDTEGTEQEKQFENGI